MNRFFLLSCIMISSVFTAQAMMRLSPLLGSKSFAARVGFRYVSKACNGWKQLDRLSLGISSSDLSLVVKDMKDQGTEDEHVQDAFCAAILQEGIETAMIRKLVFRQMPKEAACTLVETWKNLVRIQKCADTLNAQRSLNKPINWLEDLFGLE